MASEHEDLQTYTRTLQLAAERERESNPFRSAAVVIGCMLLGIALVIVVIW